MNGICLDCGHSHRWHRIGGRCLRGACGCELIRTEPRKARQGFWLDGGYDREAVEGCRYHPFHTWIPIRVGDVLEYAHDPDEILTICKGCYVPRCGTTADPDRCLLPRHHDEPHAYASGRTEAVGGYSR